MVCGASKKAKRYAALRGKRQKATAHSVRFVHSAAAQPAAGCGRKIVSFVRHGQGEHNKHAEDWAIAKKTGNPYGPERLEEFPHLVDPRLTPLGESQAKELQPKAKSAAYESVDLIVVSPMKRATDTACLAFAHVFKERSAAAAENVLIGEELEPSIPIVAHELCRECFGGKNICDKRRSISEIAADYPYIDYSFCDGSEADIYYTQGGEYEESLIERCYRFMLWVAARPEQHIVVACHSGFLLAVFNGVLEIEDPAMSSWFDTGEMRTLQLDVLGNPHPWLVSTTVPVAPTYFTKLSDRFNRELQAKLEEERAWSRRLSLVTVGLAVAVVALSRRHVALRNAR